MIELDFQNNEIVLSPTVIVSGKVTNVKNGTIQFVNNDNKVFPPQVFEINAGYFKAILHVSPNDNEFKITAYNGIKLNDFGFADFHENSSVSDSSTLKLNYVKQENHKKVHLCLIVGRDSQGYFDMPKYKLNRGEIANIDVAVKKLKVAGRLMQAFTMDDMRKLGFYNRTFQFVEEQQEHQSIFGYNVKSPVPHQEVKVHILRSNKSVSELRDANLAQQNPKASNLGGLFGHAIDLVKADPELEAERTRSGTAIQAACIYLDSTWDTRQKLILTHAALGGGTDEVKMAIFGSHGLHLWPSTFPGVTPAFLDATHLSINEVANDCNECGTSWECLNITMGAFLHEVGHSLGCPHTENGVMLRDYVWINRNFMTRENECLRRRTRGEIINLNGEWGQDCKWNYCDKMRFLYHDSFSLKPDDTDNSFGKIVKTTLKPDKLYDVDGSSASPTSFVLRANEITVTASVGFFLVEFVTDGLARAHIPFFPKSYGGNGLPKLLTFTYDQLFAEFRSRRKDGNENFDVRFLSLAGDVYIENIKKYLQEHKPDGFRGDFGLGRGEISATKGNLLGRDNGRIQVAAFNWSQLYKIKIYHGGAVDGIEFFYRTGKGPDVSKSSGGDVPPPVPRRNYLGSFVSSMKKMALQDPVGGPEGSSLLGNRMGNPYELNLQPGEYVSKFKFRYGAWIDAFQIETTKGNVTPMLGNQNGGGMGILDLPNDNYEIIGFYGYLGDWLNGVGLLFTKKEN